MASCKDCIHFEVCDSGSSIDEFMEHGTYTNGVEKECDTFKDRTRFVELPCKVGGTVYILNRANKPQEMIFDTVDLRCTCTRDDDCMCGSFCGDRNHNICQYRFMNDFSDLGKTVFLTPEAAEKALNSSENPNSRKEKTNV